MLNTKLIKILLFYANIEIIKAQILRFLCTFSHWTIQCQYNGSFLILAAFTEKEENKYQRVNSICHGTYLLDEFFEPYHMVQ